MDVCGETVDLVGEDRHEEKVICKMKQNMINILVK